MKRGPLQVLAFHFFTPFFFRSRCTQGAIIRKKSREFYLLQNITNQLLQNTVCANAFDSEIYKSELEIVVILLEKKNYSAFFGILSFALIPFQSGDYDEFA